MVEFDSQELRNSVMSILDGPGCCVGYLIVWHALQRKGIRVARKKVEEIVRELDPEGVEARKARKLHRREYVCPGPNKVWHADGFDKLKPFGFPIHGCVDGYSRKVIRLYVAAYYLDVVREYNGCPLELCTDLGTENGTMAGMHSFFMNDPNSHKYVPYPRNQRIEGWWSFFKKNWAAWWISFFRDMADNGDLDMADPLQKECLWFCFAKLLQVGLDETRDNWNTHYIRNSRHETVSGRPDSLFTIPEFHGGMGSFIVSVQTTTWNHAYSQLVEINDSETDYHDYFEYIIDELSLGMTNDWKEALELYKTITAIAVDGR